MMPDQTGPPSEELDGTIRQIANEIAGGVQASLGPSPAPVAPPRRRLTLAELRPVEPDPFDETTHPGPSLPWPSGGPAAPPGAPSPPPRGAAGVATALEREMLGVLAEPDARRAVEDLAGRIRRAVEAGATDASKYEAGRVPEVNGEVIFRDAPARILDVLDAGDPVSRLDLLQYRGGRPEAFSAVVHDRDAGWHWLGAPPPPEPGPADRVRAALASGNPAVPKIGSVIRLVRAKPASYRGVEWVALRARVLAQVDVIGPKVILDLEVIDPPVDGLDPATSQGILRGIEGPDEHREGWAPTAHPSRFRERDTRHLHEQPCDRCGGKLNHLNTVQFLSRTHDDYSRPVVFAQLCPTCADRFGRLAFIKPAPVDCGLDDLDHLDDPA